MFDKLYDQYPIIEISRGMVISLGDCGPSCQFSSLEKTSLKSHLQYKQKILKTEKPLPPKSKEN